MAAIRTAVFGCILIGAGAGLDYYLYVTKNQALEGMGATPYSSYFDSVVQRAGASVETASAAVVAPGHDLATHLPPAPEGWTRSAYVPADGEAVTGHAFEKTYLGTTATNEVLRDLAKTRKSGSHVVDTYGSGEARVIVALSYRAPKSSKTFTGEIDAQVQKNMAGFSLGPAPEVFGTVQGVVFRELPMTDFNTKTGEDLVLSYRRLRADIGKAVDILIVTNADDAALRPMLAALDLPGLARLARIQEGVVSADKTPVWGEGVEGRVDEAALAEPVAPDAQVADSATGPQEQADGVCVRRAGKLTCE